MKQYFVCMVRRSDYSYAVEVTTDVVKFVLQLETGSRLAHAQCFDTLADALEWQNSLHASSISKKIELMKRDWPRIKTFVGTTKRKGPESLPGLVSTRSKN